ncbi:TetR/AcrR family transcriptional regulator [Gynuella sunshinyii]|uniref:Transcriptional regulator n=1 Tax=Gynuella sunshinyii YC6258 TaxID=1445510 RepID=A0A0C5VVV6_9GAMM|nr:TetR/AcrR family transcriptional regulator [Gynuella sunshinyii]AJQ97448.1 transcriptional regulator [Gynuella sunshinyii YC6258]
MARRSDHSREEIKEMALEAAVNILENEGSKGISARNVAKAIGYTVGTLYLVFENQRDMLLHLNALSLDDLDAWLEEHTGSGATPTENLLQLADAYISYAVEKSARWNLLFEIQVDESNELPDWYLMRLGRLFGRVESILSPLAKQHGELEIQRAARVLWAGVHGICMLKIRQRLTLAGGQSPNEMTKMLVDNFLEGFGK